MKCNIFSLTKTSKLPELTLFRAIQMSFVLFFALDLNGVNSVHFLNRQKHRVYEVFLNENILHFVLKCTEYYKYV